MGFLRGVSAAEGGGIGTRTPLRDSPGATTAATPSGPHTPLPHLAGTAGAASTVLSSQERRPRDALRALVEDRPRQLLSTSVHSDASSGRDRDSSQHTAATCPIGPSTPTAAAAIAADPAVGAVFSNTECGAGRGGQAVREKKKLWGQRVDRVKKPLFVMLTSHPVGETTQEEQEDRGDGEEDSDAVPRHRSDDDDECPASPSSPVLRRKQDLAPSEWAAMPKFRGRMARAFRPLGGRSSRNTTAAPSPLQASETVAHAGHPSGPPLPDPHDSDDDDAGEGEGEERRSPDGSVTCTHCDASAEEIKLTPLIKKNRTRRNDDAKLPSPPPALRRPPLSPQVMLGAGNQRKAFLFSSDDEDDDGSGSEAEISPVRASSDRSSRSSSGRGAHRLPSPPPEVRTPHPALPTPAPRAARARTSGAAPHEGDPPTAEAASRSPSGPRTPGETTATSHAGGVGALPVLTPNPRSAAVAGRCFFSSILPEQHRMRRAHASPEAANPAGAKGDRQRRSYPEARRVAAGLDARTARPVLLADAPGSPPAPRGRAAVEHFASLASNESGKSSSPGPSTSSGGSASQHFFPVNKANVCRVPQPQPDIRRGRRLTARDYVSTDFERLLGYNELRDAPRVRSPDWSRIEYEDRLAAAPRPRRVQRV